MSNYRDLGFIHVAVLLFGLAGLFAEWVNLPAVWIVAGRVWFAALGLSLWFVLKGQSLRVNRCQDLGWLGLQGILLALHWVSFFAAIQASTVAIGLLTFSTFPVFTALLEPLLLQEQWRWRDGIFAGLTLVGISIVVPAWDHQYPYTWGAVLGIFSGLTFALLALLNRRMVRHYSAPVIAWYQDVVAVVVLLPFLWQTPASLQQQDVYLLVLLGVVFTALAHSLFIKGMYTIRAQTASLIASLEPVYGILAAAWWLGQIPELHVWLGGSLILGVVLVQTWLSGDASFSEQGKEE